MMKKTIQNDLIKTLLSGGIAIVRTDTLYGIVARADDPIAVERVYSAKGRNPNKSSIVLVAGSDHAYGDIQVLDSSEISSVPTSILIDAPRAPKWLLRENSLLAHRVPDVPWLLQVLRYTGPLIAPSANPEGLPPARTISVAKQYFGPLIDMYVDGGEVPVDLSPSRLIRIHDDGFIEQLR
ncbi:threonylcarbamoyl-AMP synthase [Candidatus Saccharibacteria bacterium]|nr:threonylcarbamoyl-AMP synthase [Candidatus Saccharibacteria bacterium]